MAQHAHLSDPAPEWAPIAAHLPPAFVITSIPAFVEQVDGFMDPLTVKIVTEGVNIVEKHIPREEHNGSGPGDIRLKAYIPDVRPGESGGFPLMYWVYGGSWVLGKIEREEAFLQSAATDHRVICVCAEYRKPPKDPYPSGINDIYTAFKWALKNTSEISVNVSKGVIIGGLSAGGNMAAGMLHRAMNDPRLERDVVSGQLLIMPSVIMRPAYPEKFQSELLSFDEDPDPNFLTKQQLVVCTEVYHQGINAANPEVSPLLAEFTNYPPTYLQICGRDPFRDEGFLYKKLLEEAQVKTKVDVYPGFAHGFHVFFKDLQESKKQRRDFDEGMRWLLEQSK